LTTSAPRDASFCALGDDGLRVMHRTCQLGRARKVFATEPPWFPVAPTTTMIFWFEDDILLQIWTERLLNEQDERKHGRR